MTWEQQRTRLHQTQQRTVVGFGQALSVVVGTLALFELVSGTVISGILLMFVALSFLAVSHAVSTRRIEFHTGAMVLSGLLLFGATAINIGSGGRAVGVLIFLPVLVTVFVLLLSGWKRLSMVALAILQIPLAWQLSQMPGYFPLMPDPGWVESALYRVSILASIATFLIGTTYQYLMTYYREACETAMLNWREEANAGRRAAARLQEFADACADVLWETDSDLCFSYLSDGFDSLFQLRKSAAIGLTPAQVHDRFSGMEGQNAERFMPALRRHEPLENRTLLWSVEQGNIKRITYTACPIFDAAGVFQGYRGVMHDVTREHAARQALEYQATHDQLTGLLKRQSFLDKARLALAGCQKRGAPAAVAFIDLDDFKRINDVAGHEFGDELLIRVAETIRENSPDETQIAARLGGDEFAIFVEDRGAEWLEGICHSLLTDLIGIQVIAKGQALTVGASIGIYAQSPVTGSDIGQWLKRADESTYVAKEKGKASIHIAI